MWSEWCGVWGVADDDFDFLIESVDEAKEAVGGESFHTEVKLRVG